MRPVTPRQMDVLKFISAYRARNGYSPTMQEIGDHLRLSKVTVFEHVAALEKKGLLLRGQKHTARSLEVPEGVELPPVERPTRIVLAGRIAAGHPLEAIQDEQALDLEEMFARGPEPTFCLRVAGNSMIEEQIRDGDYVICAKRMEARNGETVVALLDNGEATLKKFYREKGGRFRLQPANPSFSPIYADNVRIQGVVIGVVRKI